MAGSVARFTVAGLAVTTVLVVVMAVQGRRAGDDQALRSSENLARVAAAGLTPSLDAAPAADVGRREILREQVAALRRAGPVVRVVVWDADGLARWSDDPAVVGRTAPLGPGERQALQQGTTGSAIKDDGVTDGFPDRDAGELLEAYVGVRDVHGTPLLVDVYQRRDDAASATRSIWARSVPTAVGALLLLQLVQAPLAWRLARRLRRSLERQSRLLRAAVDAADAERHRIAGEVHDHVLQDLTGLALDLDVAALRGAQAPSSGDLLAGTAARLRKSIDDLRTILVGWMPSRLPGDRMGPALQGLAAGLERSGIAVRLDDDGVDDLPVPVAALLYRCAQEALRNVVSHSRATTVELTVHTEGGRVTMVIDDDGCGVDGTRLRERLADGHVGLRTLGELVADAGGSLTAFSSPGEGTRVVTTVPLATGSVAAGGLR